MVINVSFKVTGGKEFTITIDPDISVLELKQKCLEHSDIPVEFQRIIFKGKILKDKETLSKYNVADGNTMHLVRSAIPVKEPEAEKENDKSEDVSNDQNANPSGNFNDMSGNPLVQMLLQNEGGDASNMNNSSISGDNANFANFAHLLNPNNGEFNREMFNSVLSNPLARSLLNELSNNPELLRSLIYNNPFLRNTFSENSIIQPILGNPNLLREIMRPEILQAGLQIENALNMNNNNNNNSNQLGGGLRMEDLLNSFNSVANNGNNPLGANNNNNSSNANTNNINGGSNMNNNALNSFLQSPELMQSFQQMLRGNRDLPNMNLPNFNFPNINQNLNFNNAPNVVDNRPPQEIYASQLLSLQEMGFIDNDANIQALQETNGDVNSAVTRLLEKGFN